MGVRKKEALEQFNRDNILGAAKELFESKGVEKTTMDDIAALADYSKSTIYVYFKSKEEIYNSIVEDYIDKKEVRRLDRYSQFALIAADEAFNDSKLVWEEMDVIVATKPLIVSDSSCNRSILFPTVLVILVVSAARFFNN